jgi:putative NIF3 family GTP cyclohydrolase 1 type 2
MNWIDIFKKGINLGIESDIRKNMASNSPPDRYDLFYPDSLIITGDNKKEIKNLYVAIDTDTSEILLVKELINSGLDIDGILSHHPVGKGYYLLSGVIEIQRDNWIKFGVNKAVANKLLARMIYEEEIEAKDNQTGALNACQKLNIPLMCIHTPIDNIIQNFFEDLFIHKNNLSYGEALEIVNNIPECRQAAANGDKPFIVNDNNKNIGKFMVDMTGGVDPPDEIFSHLKKAGVDTLIGMHYGIDNIKSIKKNNISALVCGHMACDSIGMNIFCDVLEGNGIKIISGSGFYRYKRNG